MTNTARDGDPLAAIDWPVRTKRLLLRRARPADAEATWQIRRLSAVQERITTAPSTRERARDVQAELGWTLDPAFGGRGFATEAARVAIDLCFGPLRLRRVVAGCFADNTVSWRLMERIGMRRQQHTIRDGLHRSGRWLDGYSYAVLRDEWPPPP